MLLAAGLLASGGVIAALEVRESAGAAQRVRHTFEVLRQIDRVRAALLDAETGQRGYVLTGELRYLEPYERGAREVEPGLEGLRVLLPETPENLRRIGELKEIGSAKLRELARTIELRQTGGLEAALAVVRTELGVRTMDHFRDVLDALGSAEEARLAERLSLRERQSRNAFLATVALSGLSLLTFAGVVASLRAAMRRRAAAEQTALESEARLRVTLGSIGDAVIATDLSGAIVYMNAVAQALTGWREADARGLPLDQVFRIVNELTRETVESPVSKVLREGSVVGLANHTVLLARDGSERPIDDSGAPIRRAGGDLMGVVLVFRDVSARRQTELARERLLRSESARDAAESANRAKDEFLAVVSHELRSPLAAAVGWIDLLRGGNLERGEAERALGTIERNLRQQALLIDDLLDVSRIVSGKLTVECVPADVGVLVQAAADDAREKAEAKGVELRVSGARQSALAMVDPHRFAQVLANLLDNAVKFTPEGGVVELRMGTERGSLEIEVSDSGQGIDPDFLPHVFERFRQAQSARERGQAGLGLGLAIARHLVELQGGTIVAESKGAGRGAAFRVQVPLLAASGEAPARRAPASRESKPLAGAEVLLVEDHADTREAIALMLRARGAEVREATSAAEALHSFAAQRPSIVVSDIGMPGESGLLLIEELRRREWDLGGRTPAVAMTGFASAQDRQEALAAGYDAHVPKPVDLAKLVETLRLLLEARPEGSGPR